jgi:hypothetical protein
VLDASYPVPGPSRLRATADFLNDVGVAAFIEATPAAPADILTFQRFGALRNPPVSERGDDTPARNWVG